MVQFPNNAAGQQLASHYRERQKDAPNSLAITVINKYGTDADNTGLGSLADPEKLKELYRAKVDSKLEGVSPPRAVSGLDVGKFIRENKGLGFGDLPPISQPEPAGEIFPSGSTGFTPETPTDTRAQLPPVPQEIIDFNPVVENAEPAEGLSAPQTAAIQGVANVASSLIKAAMAPDPEPVSVAPRPKFGKLRQIKHKAIGPPSQFSARGGTVLGRELFLGGGEVDGPGGPKEDLVPVWASDQEYVVSANGVKRLGNGNHSRGIAALNQINFGGK
jgi:hypothetical protein